LSDQTRARANWSGRRARHVEAMPMWQAAAHGVKPSRRDRLAQAIDHALAQQGTRSKRLNATPADRRAKRPRTGADRL
jgi:hypothetical protein